MTCLDEDALTDLAAGRLRIDSPGVEEHLGECASCACLLGRVAGVDLPPEAVTVTSGQANVGVGRSGRGHQDARGVLAAGTVLRGTYTVLRPIGSGGMGEVYEVSHVRLAGRYAVKVLRAEVWGDEELLARFRREAEITSALRHPHIVQVIDFDRTDEGCVFLAMEYLQGCDLANLIARDGQLPLDRTLRLARQVASALAAAHRRGIVHRDLKPANVFIVEDDEGERVKLMDFGLSKWMEKSIAGLSGDGGLSSGLSRDQALIGTPRYMAPEQARGRHREVTAAADQFALAALIFEMMAGHSPFTGETLGELLHAILFEAPAELHASRPDLPLAVGEALGRALSKAPEQRYASIADLMAALELAAAQPAPGRRRVRPGRARRTPALWMTVVATLALFATVARGLFDDETTPPPQPISAAAPAPSPPAKPSPSPSPSAAQQAGSVLVRPASPAQKSRSRLPRRSVIVTSPSAPAPATPAAAPEPALVETPVAGPTTGAGDQDLIETL